MAIPKTYHQLVFEEEQRRLAIIDGRTKEQLRIEFTKAAMQGLSNTDMLVEDIAHKAVMIADATIAELNKRGA